mmetsp:Transcript_18103/g.37132  ORF Transcript_18103/g.37132 Transcript_18103/m.37132 type:complete len:82 (-) Transcript_18103:29-274(-)
MSPTVVVAASLALDRNEAVCDCYGCCHPTQYTRIDGSFYKSGLGLPSHYDVLEISFNEMNVSEILMPGVWSPLINECTNHR